jgi:glutathione S-transferase
MGIEPVVYGAPYSVYVRAVRLALEEKGVPYRLVPIDVFTPDGPPKEYLNRQPFGRIPAFEHGGFQLYEAGAITRYVDEAFPGPVLQPTARTPSQNASGDKHSGFVCLSDFGLGDLQPEIWTVQNGNFLVISPAGRRENSHEGVEIFGTADCADLEAG